MPRTAEGRKSPMKNFFPCSNSLLPSVPPDQSQGLTDVEFPPATGKGTFSNLEEHERVSTPSQDSWVCWAAE